MAEQVVLQSGVGRYDAARKICIDPKEEAKPVAKRKVTGQIAPSFLAAATVVRSGSGVLAGCSGESPAEANECSPVVPVIGAADISQENFRSKLDLLVQNGKARVLTTFTTVPTIPRGDIILNISSQNGAISADGEGNLSITANPTSACIDTTQIRSCTPYAGVPGLVPIGVPKISKTNGKIIMQKADDHNVYAVRAEMRDTTYGHPVFVMTDKEGKPVNIGSTTTGEGDNEKTIIWFEVNADGTQGEMLSEADNAVLNSMTNSLPQAMAYYQTDSDGKYIDEGTPKPRPDLESVEFRIVARENIPFEQLLLGNGGDFRGLAVTGNSEKPIDLEQVKQYARALRVKIEVFDASGKPVVDPQEVALADVLSPTKLTLPTIKNNQEGNQPINFTVKIAAELGDMGDQFLADYVWALVFVAKIEDSGCK